MKVNLDTKYLYIINADLKMSKGKIAAQVSHVAMQLGERYGEIGRAIVLKAIEPYIRSALNYSQLNPIFFIEDAGLTEVPKGSLTCIGFKENSVSTEFTKGLKLV